MRCIGLICLAACRIGFDPVGGGRDSIASNDGIGARVNNVAFVTSTGYPGNVGGIPGADQTCQMHADRAGLGGSFVALLDPDVARLAGSRGWIDVTGLPIVDQPEGWYDGRMLHPLRRDEYGTLLTDIVWIGGGPAFDCGQWSSTSDAGYIATTAEMYTIPSIAGCTALNRLACVERGHDAALAVPTVAGRYAFTTDVTWLPAGGFAGADAFCMQRASGLPGTYGALLAGAASAPFDRFSSAGPTWTRVDGIPLAPTAADVLDPLRDLDSFPSLTATGAPTIAAVWLGDGTDQCQDWTSNMNSRSGARGQVTTVAQDRVLTPVACNTPLRVICLQQ